MRIAGAIDIESVAVIATAKLDRVPAGLDCDPGVSGAAVFDDIVNAFLNDAIENDLSFPLKVSRQWFSTALENLIVPDAVTLRSRYSRALVRPNRSS